MMPARVTAWQPMKKVLAAMLKIGPSSNGLSTMPCWASTSPPVMNTRLAVLSIMWLATGSESVSTVMPEAGRCSASRATVVPP